MAEERARSPDGVPVVATESAEAVAENKPATEESTASASTTTRQSGGSGRSSRTDYSLGELISLLYDEYMEIYGNEDLAAIATAATINDLLGDEHGLS